MNTATTAPNDPRTGYSDSRARWQDRVQLGIPLDEQSRLVGQVENDWV
jgi:hypothetical protein